MRNYIDQSDTGPDEVEDRPRPGGRLLSREGGTQRSTNIFDHVQSLGATIEVLEENVQRLLMALEPILSPEESVSEKAMRTPADRTPQSDLAHSLDNLTEQVDRLRRRVLETHGRLEL